MMLLSPTIALVTAVIGPPTASASSLLTAWKPSDPGHPAGRGYELPYDDCAEPDVLEVSYDDPSWCSAYDDIGSLKAGGWTSDDYVLIVPEAMGVEVDSADHPSWEWEGDFSGAADSFLIHFDPIIEAGVRAVGAITFACPVVAIVAEGTALDASDNLLGAPDCSGITYERDNVSQRGLETDGAANPIFLLQDIVTVDGKAISFDLQASNAMDEFRVVTEACDATQIGLRNRRYPLIRLPESPYYPSDEKAWVALVGRDGPRPVISDFEPNVCVIDGTTAQYGLARPVSIIPAHPDPETCDKVNGSPHYVDIWSDGFADLRIDFSIPDISLSLGRKATNRGREEKQLHCMTAMTYDKEHVYGCALVKVTVR